MTANMGFWFWLVLMLFITGVLGSLTVLVWRSDRRSNRLGDYRPQMPPATRQPEGLEAKETREVRE